jgi:hypothetical protein
VPSPVTNWTVNTFPTAKSLNLALYTADGTYGAPTGIQWNALRYITFSAFGNTGTTAEYASSPTSGTRSQLGSGGGVSWPANMMLDNAGYYGAASDGPWWLAGYTFQSAVSNSTGELNTPGGLTLMWHFIPVNTHSTTDSIGADLNSNGSFSVSGTRVRPPNPGNFACCAFFLDVQDSFQEKMQPAILVVDSSSGSVSPVVNTNDCSGTTPRFYTMWCGVSPSLASSYGTVASLPVPFTGYTNTTTIGTTNTADVNLNGSNGIVQPMNLLANPPTLRVYQTLSQSISNLTATQVTFSASANPDSYSGFSSSTYTVQLDGLYLVHGITPWSANTSGQRRTGVNINGTVYWGPGYQACAAGTTISAKTQVFSLNAGDTVQLYSEQSSGGSLSLSNADGSRLILIWLGTEGAVSQNWTPPDLSFRWEAGTPGSALPGLFQQHIANDISFLMQRPYLLAYQTVQQTGFANNTNNVVTMDTVGGIVHGDVGDNYGGWSSGSSNSYVAQVPGWYLVVAEYFATVPSTPTTASIAACLQVGSTSGGRTPNTTPDRYQQMYASSGNFSPGATAMGLYYLNTGESIQPIIQGLAYTSTTWNTAVSSGNNSHIEILWVSE